MSTLAPMTPPSPVAVEPRLGRFEDDAVTVLSQVRKAFGKLIESLPGPVKGAGDVQRVLGIDKALAWQLFRVGSVADPVAAGADMPRPAPVAKALKAAAAQGVRPAIISEVKDAFAAFEDLVQRHAGDRGSFDAMVRGLGREVEAVHVKERRAAYRANSNIWGLQAEAKLSCVIIHEGAAGTEDNVLVSGYVGLRKLRPGVQVYVAGRSVAWTSSEAAPGLHGESTPGHRRAVELLKEFSTQPLPELTTREIEPAVLETTLELDSVGRSGAVTYFMRDIARAAGQGVQTLWGSTSVSRLPMEVAVMDLLIPIGWSDPETTQVATYGNLRDNDRAWNRNEADRIPVSETMSHVGQDLDRLQTPHIPRYPEMVDEVLKGMGWARTQFDIYRCVVQYPILYAGVATRVDAVKK